MTLGSFVISSLLLSWIGWGVYLLLRWLQPSPKIRRRMIWMVVISSLLVPFTAPFSQYAGTYGHPANAHTELAGSSSVIPPAGQSIHEFCHCTQPKAGDVILYQASRVYDILLANAPWINLLLLVCTLFFLIRYLVGLRQLIGLVKSHSAEPMTIENQQLWCIRAPGKLAAGSLWLGKKYLFWHPQLDRLSNSEQQAILLHELSHLNQGNTIEKLILSLLQGIWFLNPVYYFFDRELETLSEYTADDYASGKLASRKHYAHLLLRIKSEKHLSMLHFFKGGHLRKRIERILKGPGKARLSVWPAIALGVVLLISSEIAAQNLIQTRLMEMEIYEYLSKAHEETGQDEFCKKCTLEAVDCPNMDW